jgi:hypothetical protein
VTVYSTRFIGQNVSPGSPALYDVPTGYVAVIRDITLVPQASGLTAAQGIISGIAVFYEVTSGTVAVGQYWTGRVVLTPGETLEFNVAGAACNVTVSGYLLTT